MTEERYQPEACTCGGENCDNWVVIDTYPGWSLPVAHSLSKPQAFACARVMNELAHTNNPESENINELPS